MSSVLAEVSFNVLLSIFYVFRPGETMEYGPFLVHNEGMSMTMDPLFQVTSLTLSLVDDPSQTHTLQHWQYDWNDFSDFYWPIRLLKR
jgi:hypothetical protein